MRLEFSASAVRDLTRLREFVAVRNPDAARRVSKRLRQAIGKLVLYPNLGRAVAELENVREFVAGNYIIRYSHTEEVVYILRVWHGKEYRDIEM